jgi:hypothetical protein
MNAQQIIEAFNEYVTNGPANLPPDVALEIGKMTWSDLQRVEAELADEVDAAIDEWAYTVPIPQSIKRNFDVLSDPSVQPRGQG